MLKLLKIFHALFGVLALTLTLALANDLVQLTAARIDFNSSAVLILMAVALCNLLMAAPSFLGTTTKNLLQIIASKAVLLSTILSTWSVVEMNSKLLGHSNELLAIIVLVSGVLLHFLLNITTSDTSVVSIDHSDRETGTVKWFNITKGFGFITRDSGEDVFVHYRAIRGEGHRTLSEGQRVEFIVVDKDKGLQAEDVIAAPKGR